MRLLISNARIVDGTGADPRVGDVLVEDDAIAEVGETSLAPDAVLDAEGLVVAPGFIDVHSHGDFTRAGSPGADAKVRQGVTSEVVGNCGIGLQPANERVDAMYEKLAPLIFGEHGGSCARSVGDYREKLERGGLSINQACLIPHGNVRCAAMGMAERPARAEELDQMREIVARGMEEGGFGLSTGLVYPPGAYAATEEIIELARVVAPHDGIYATHMRDEGGGLVKSVAEAIRIGEEARVPVQISHHKAAGRLNWGKVEKTLGMVDAARSRGVDVSSDVYPYTAGSTVLSAMFLPLWVFEGSNDEMLARLRDPAMRTRIIADSKARMLTLAKLPGILDVIVPKRLFLPLALRELEKLVVISSCKRQHEYEGMTLREMRLRRGQNLYDALLDLLAEEDTAVAAIAHVMHEDDVRRVMRHGTTMIGSDGFEAREGKPHPRTYGTYARVLEHYVRETKVLSLASAVHKMTGMVAAKAGLADRGTIEAGKKADLVLFDPDGVHDRATYDDPKHHPDGIPHVMVNGEWTVKDGAHTGARAGRVLRRATRAA